MNNLKNKTVLITGGSSGIGLAFARALSAAGAKVAINGRNVHRLEKAAAEIGAAWIHSGDLSLPQDRQTLVDMTHQQFGSLDILINNAGFMLQPDLLEGGGHLNRIDEEVLTNLSAPIDLSSRLIPALEKSDLKIVIMVTSGFALAPGDRAPIYSAAKAGLRAFTKSFRRIVAKKGLSVIEVLPPLVDTPATEATAGKKITPEAVVEATLKGIKGRKQEVLVGQVKMLPGMLRWLPGLTEGMMAKS